MTTSLRWMAGALMVASIGCSAESGEDRAPTAEGEDALMTQLVSGAVAVEIDVIPMLSQTTKPTKVTLGAPSKLKKIVESVKKRPASTAIPRCMPAYRVELHFLDAKGKETSKVDTSCGGFGNLWKGSATTPIQTSLDYVAISAEPLVPGDALWGVNEIEVTQLRTLKSTKAKSASELAPLLGAIDLEQAIDSQKAQARCMPAYAVTFRRAAAEVASTSFVCDAQTPSKLDAHFEIAVPGGNGEPLVGGVIELDPRPFVRLF